MKKFVSVLLILVMMLGVLDVAVLTSSAAVADLASTQVGGTNFNNAQTITLNCTLQGIRYGEGESDQYYKFKITKSGKLNIVSTLNITKGSSYINYTLYDNNYTKIEWEMVGTGREENNYYLKAGTYYLVLDTSYSYVTYSLALKHTAYNESFVESQTLTDDKQAYAHVVKPGITYRGMLSTSYRYDDKDVDYYLLKLNKETDLTFVGYVQGNESVTFKVTDVYGSQVMNIWAYKGRDEESRRLAVGSYYIEVTGSNDGCFYDFTMRTPDTAYNAPVLGSAVNTAKGVKFSWMTNGSPKYRVYRSTSGSGWTKLADVAGNVSSYLDKTVKSGVTYKYTVRSTYSNNSAASTYQTAGVSVKYVAAPKISKMENKNGYIKLTWGKVSGASKYRVYIKNGSSWAIVKDTTANSITYKNVKSGKANTFTVRCLDKNGKSLSSYNSTGFKQTYIAMPTVSKLTNTKSGVKVQWGKIAGAARYRVFVKSGSKWVKAGDTTGTSFVYKAAKNGKSYTFTVRCYTKNGKTATSTYDTKGKAIKCKR